MMDIIKIQAAHYAELAAIYRQGIATGNATFQTEAPAWEQWDSSHLPHSRLAAFINNRMVGWAALSPVSSRCVYAGVAEISIYIAETERGKGTGKALLTALVQESEANGLWTLQSSLFPENTASARLHQQCGFREVGYREKIGKMKGVWRDNILLERRSKITGT